MDFLIDFEKWKWKIHTKYTETHNVIYEQIFNLEKEEKNKRQGKKWNEREI